MIQKFRKEGDIFMKKLSKRQYEIMCIMWNADRPLLASEIVKSRDDLNINTVQSSSRKSILKLRISHTAELYWQEHISPWCPRNFIFRKCVVSLTMISEPGGLLPHSQNRKQISVNLINWKS